MSLTGQFAVDYAVSLCIGTICILVILFLTRKRLVPWYQGHSQLQQMAIDALGAWAFGLLMLSPVFFYFGKTFIPYLTALCTTGSALHFIRIQNKFKRGKLKKSVFQLRIMFDERDYLIGQEAMQTAYTTFWKLLVVTGWFLFFFAGVLQLDIPFWFVVLIFPVMAFIVSLVHAITILVLYRRENREMVEDA